MAPRVQILLLGCLVFEDDVDCMDDTRNPTKNGQTDVDEEISTASCLKEHSKRGEDEGENKLANVRGSERHCEFADGMNR